ncbi:glucosamine-6-phosphate deaminase [Clostridium sp. chh4-2]|uniref:glucosamine-6-phosphate deaminase n=1 Tax=Clostridium sp. chh4-2 TaxID=2067550 RepID=UPI000CCEBFEE|nr:glucosamine-6-phosphate deaminase [Clostridium sp. chh4-2]PNV63894.1 glucosamine-6-phosphate deaminase [Clostridium sp. chh4-2]
MSVIKDFYCDKLYVRIFDTRDAMGCCAGREAAACVRKLLEGQKEVNIIFAAAPSQNEVLGAFASEPDIDWNRINAFHMDEYVGLKETHPAGFRNFLKAALFDHKPFCRVNLLDGNNPGEADRYSALLRQYPPDVCLLGIGENGHIAFNDPGVASFRDDAMVKAVTLDEECRNQQVHDGCFAHIDEVPKQALTITIPGLMAAKYLFCTVPGITKAEAVERMICGEISEACPASILREHAHARMYTDSDSGSRILGRE